MMLFQLKSAVTLEPALYQNNSHCSNKLSTQARAWCFWRSQARAILMKINVFLSLALLGNLISSTCLPRIMIYVYDISNTIRFLRVHFATRFFPSNLKPLKQEVSILNVCVILLRYNREDQLNFGLAATKACRSSWSWLLSRGFRLLWTHNTSMHTPTLSLVTHAKRNTHASINKHSCGVHTVLLQEHRLT